MIVLKTGLRARVAGSRIGVRDDWRREPPECGVRGHTRYAGWRRGLEKPLPIALLSSLLIFPSKALKYFRHASRPR